VTAGTAAFPEGSDGPTAVLASFAASTDYESLPARTIAQAKLSILDTIGCALLGSTLPWGRMLQGLAADQGGHPLAAVWGTNGRTSSTQAALVNATAAHSFEFDDVHMGGMFHPGALTLAAAMAVGERGHLDGRSLLAAVVVGCEVGARVGMAVGPAHFRAGFHPQGTVGVFAAAACAGRALGLDPERMHETLGIAGSHASGLMAAQEGAMVKRLHSGHACQSGVTSALLAERGFTGIRDVFEAAFGGFLGTLGGGEVAESELTADLGRRWETERIGFKPYASCAAAQSSLDVVRRIRQAHGVEAADVLDVRIRASTHATIHCGWEYQPTGVTAAQMNIPFGVACMLRDGSVSARHFTDASIVDPELVVLAHRVHVAPDTGIDALGNDKRYTVDVEIETTDGLVLHGHGDDRPGGPSQPLSRDQVIAKYGELAGPVVGDDRAKSIRALVEVIDELDDVGELATLLAYDSTA
jgi:2-methylcitrate dehydratase PrpD